MLMYTTRLAAALTCVRRMRTRRMKPSERAHMQKGLASIRKHMHASAACREASVCECWVWGGAWAAESGNNRNLQALAQSKSGNYRKLRALARSESGNYRNLRALARSKSGNYRKLRALARAKELKRERWHDRRVETIVKAARSYMGGATLRTGRSKPRAPTLE